MRDKSAWSVFRRKRVPRQIRRRRRCEARRVRRVRAKPTPTPEQSEPHRLPNV